MNDSDEVIIDLIRIIHNQECKTSDICHDVRDALCYPKMLIDTQDITDATMIRSIEECLDATTKEPDQSRVCTTVASVLADMNIPHDVDGFTINIPEPTFRMIVGRLCSPESKVYTTGDQLVITNGRKDHHELIEELLSVYGSTITNSPNIEDQGSFVIDCIAQPTIGCKSFGSGGSSPF